VAVPGACVQNFKSLALDVLELLGQHSVTKNLGCQVSSDPSCSSFIKLVGSLGDERRLELAHLQTFQTLYE